MLKVNLVIKGNLTEELYQNEWSYSYNSFVKGNFTKELQ